MLFKILIRYLLGYVNISVQGYYIERFLNICISKNLFLWNTKIEKATYAHANVGVQDFKKLKEVARKTKCRITLNSKHGVPFLMNRYRKRKVFAVLLAMISLFIYLQSRFIWNIEIEGLNRIQEEEILQELSQLGVEIGTLKSNINPKEVINKVRLDRDDIAWMNMDLKRD